MQNASKINSVKEVGRVGENVLAKSKEARTASLKVAMELYLDEMTELAFNKNSNSDKEYWKIIDFNANTLLGLMRRDGYIKESEYWFYNGEIEACESYYENRILKD